MQNDTHQKTAVQTLSFCGISFSIDQYIGRGRQSRWIEERAIGALGTRHRDSD